jgi:hypothetical protein
MASFELQGREGILFGGVPLPAGQPISSRRRPIISPPAPRVGSQNPASQFPKTGSFADFSDEVFGTVGGFDPNPAHRAMAGATTANDQIARMVSDERIGLATAETPFAFILCICIPCHVRCVPFHTSIEIRAS